MKRIYFTVTNDLVYDQRMQRICTSLAAEGYTVTLVGRRLPNSPKLPLRDYNQKRIYCWFKKGKWFYAEYNIRLFFFLLLSKMDAICAIDLDTILPVLKVSQWKNISRIYDAHELFSELKEVITRPPIQKKWLQIERKAVPKFQLGYTVSESIAQEFNNRYGVNYNTIRNVPILSEYTLPEIKTETFILYQGAVNEARGFEYLIPAMKQIDCKLIICGDGNFMPQLKTLIVENNVTDKVELKGMLPPEELSVIAQKATIGIALAEKEGLNQYLALPNKFFDYIHADLPQISMAYPEYVKINTQYEVALLIDSLDSNVIATAINNLLVDEALRNRLRNNCLTAKQELNWQIESRKLIEFYKQI